MLLDIHFFPRPPRTPIAPCSGPLNLIDSSEVSQLVSGSAFHARISMYEGIIRFVHRFCLPITSYGHPIVFRWFQSCYSIPPVVKSYLVNIFLTICCFSVSWQVGFLLLCYYDLNQHSLYPLSLTSSLFSPQVYYLCVLNVLTFTVGDQKCFKVMIFFAINLFCLYFPHGAVFSQRNCFTGLIVAVLRYELIKCKFLWFMYARFLFIKPKEYFSDTHNDFFLSFSTVF